MERHTPDHPRATGGHPYVFEHILVMEEILGRYLLPGENVHHLNGVRDDNRPENLELWTKPQPPGIRVVDAVAWAREILARYVDDEGVEPSSYPSRHAALRIVEPDVALGDGSRLEPSAFHRTPYGNDVKRVREDPRSALPHT